MSLSKEELFIKQACIICCPICDEKKCVGRFNCNEIKRFVEKLKEMQNGI